MALKDETAERSGAAPKPVLKHILRPRTMLYFTLWAGIGVALVVALFLRSPFDLNVTPVRNPLYVTMADGAIRNTYALRLRNKQGAERDFAVSVTGSDGAAPQGISLTLEACPMPVSRWPPTAPIPSGSTSPPRRTRPWPKPHRAS